MTKIDIIEKIYEKFNDKITKKDISEIVDKVFNIMKESLEKDKELKIKGFGTWKVKEKKERKGRNPQTGETIIIPPRKVVSFKVSRILKEKINS